MHQAAYCKLICRPSADLVSVVRRFVSNFFDEILADEDTSSRIALATHELLENAVKYSSDGEAVLVLELLAGPSGKMVNVEISNRADDRHTKTLAKLFDDMRAKEPAIYYQELLRQNMKRAELESGGLGLARIRAEADMSLTLSLDGDRVRIDARCPVPETQP
jgi:hypothetical protein